MGEVPVNKDLVVMLCHEVISYMCHLPLLTQYFSAARIQYAETNETAITMMTSHKVDPMCETNCSWYKHPNEKVVLFPEYDLWPQLLRELHNLPSYSLVGDKSVILI